MTRDRLLWIGIFTGPIVFLTSFLANFVMAPLACVWQWKPALFGVSLTALAITCGSAAIAWRQWTELGRRNPEDGEGAVPRARIMAFGGVGLSLLFILVIVAQGIVESILGACE